MNDWVRVRLGLMKHSRVTVMVQHLYANQEFRLWLFGHEAERPINKQAIARIVISALADVWGSIRLEVVEDFCRAMPLDHLDAITGIPGFAKAMVASGWVVESSEPPGLMFPNYAEWNNPVNSTERTRRYRAKQQGLFPGTDGNGDEGVPGDEKESKSKSKSKREEDKETPPKPPSGGHSAGNIQTRFELFWRVYPRRVGKGAALNAWKRLAPDTALTEQIIQAVKHQSVSEQWVKEGGRFVPNPATWLNQQRWLDEPPPGSAVPPPPGPQYTPPPKRLTPEEREAANKSLREWKEHRTGTQPPQEESQ